MLLLWFPNELNVAQHTNADSACYVRMYLVIFSQSDHNENIRKIVCK